jgi:hypothetical protein
VPTDLFLHRLSAHQVEVRDSRRADWHQDEARLDAVPNGQARPASSRRCEKALQPYACSSLTQLWLIQTTVARIRDQSILAVPDVWLHNEGQETDKDGEARARSSCS